MLMLLLLLSSSSSRRTAGPTGQGGCALTRCCSERSSCDASTNTSPWGEHEIDYVLFFSVKDKAALTIKPHPDEVDACRWVTRRGLMDMMEDKKLLFSPWFRLICKKWLLDSWWKDLNETMTTDKYCDFVKIYRFDPPKEVRGRNKLLRLYLQLHQYRWRVCRSCTRVPTNITPPPPTLVPFCSTWAEKAWQVHSLKWKRRVTRGT